MLFNKKIVVDLLLPTQFLRALSLGYKNVTLMKIGGGIVNNV